MSEKTRFGTWQQRTPPRKHVRTGSPFCGGALYILSDPIQDWIVEIGEQDRSLGSQLQQRPIRRKADHGELELLEQPPS